MIHTIRCPKCGKEGDPAESVGAFCPACYDFKIKLPEIHFKKCKKCERVLFDKEWLPYNKKKIEERIVSRLKGSFNRADYYLDAEQAVFYFEIGGKVHMENRTLSPKIEIVMCPNCSRESGGYFEAILQFRGNKKSRKFFANKLHHLLSNKTYVNKVEEKKEGIDLYVGSTKVVLNVLKEMGLTYKISRTLHTQKEGKMLYRTTFAIRFE